MNNSTSKAFDKFADPKYPRLEARFIKKWPVRESEQKQMIAVYEKYLDLCPPEPGIRCFSEEPQIGKKSSGPQRKQSTKKVSNITRQ